MRTFMHSLAAALLATAAITSTAYGQAVERLEDETTLLARQRTINFTGSGVACVNNAGAKRTDCTISASSTSATLTTPVISGAITGTYSIAGTPTLASQLSIATGLGAVAQITGPTDQPFALAAGAARGFTLTGNLASTVSTTSGNLSLDAASALNIGSNATSVAISGTNPAVTVSVGTGSTTLSSTAATARAGVRNANTRNIVRASSVAVPDCAAATLNLTVTQFLDAGACTCGTAQTINFPTWQGASGIVQGLPGTPAVGDVVLFEVAASAANALTVGAGTGGTIAASTTVPANASKLYWCKLTAITTNSETATCY